MPRVKSTAPDADASGVTARALSLLAAFASPVFLCAAIAGWLYGLWPANPVTLGLALFCVSGGLAIGALGTRVANREVSTGTILAFATGLGVLFASLASENTSTVTSVTCVVLRTAASARSFPTRSGSGTSPR